MAVLVDLLTQSEKGEHHNVRAVPLDHQELVEVLKNNGIERDEFVGKRRGVTQADQQQTIEAFRRGKFRVLVASIDRRGGT